MTIEERKQKAAELFCAGYNCSQAVFAAFCDITGFEEKAALRLASSFGGGMGRLREVCGAVSGMLLVAGILYGYDTPNHDAQMHVYETEQALAAQFREKAGSIVCRDILKNPHKYQETALENKAYQEERKKKHCWFFKSLSHQYSFVSFPVCLLLAVLSAAVLYGIFKLIAGNSTMITPGPRLLGVIAMVFLNIDLGTVILPLHIKTTFFAVAVKDAFNGSRYSIWKKSYITLLIFFAITFPLYALSANHYIFYDHHGVTASGFFEITETYTAYEDIEELLTHRKQHREQILNEIKNQNMDDVRFQNAFDLISKGEDEKALEEIRLFLQNNPEVWNAWFMLGWALRKMGRFEDAKQAFLEAIKFGAEKNADTLNELALCSIQLKEFSLAKKYLLDAFALEPESTKIISNLGYLALAEGNKQEARNYFATVFDF